MPTVSVKVSGLKEAMQLFDKKKVEQAKRWTLKEVANQARVEGNKAIEELFNIKKTDFKTNLKIGRVQDNEISILITARRRSGSGDYYGIPASYFGAVEIRKTSKGTRVLSRAKSKTLSSRKVELLPGGSQGVTVQIRRGGQIATYPNAFIARMKSGHVGVFIRSKNKKMQSNPKKAALIEAATVAFPSLFQSKSGADKEPITRMKQKVNEVWEKVFWYKLEDALGVKLVR